MSHAASSRGGVGRLMAAADVVSTWTMRLSSVMLVVIAAMLFYEVIMRYFFHNSTSWAQDVAIALQIWMTFLGMAYVLRRREFIQITAVAERLGRRGKYAVEAFTLIVIALFSVVTVVYGLETVIESIQLGRRQPTVMQLPNWVTETAIVVGFALLALQAIADLVRLPSRPVPNFSPAAEGAD